MTVLITERLSFWLISALLLNHVHLLFVHDRKVRIFVNFLVIVVDGSEKNQSSFMTLFAAR